MSKRVLLTGVGGAIGTHMVDHIIENTQWDIVGVDSFRPLDRGYIDRIKPHKRLEIITHDLNAPFTDREVEKLGQIDYIINLASRSDVHLSIDDPIPFVRNNIELMLTMLDLAVKVKPRAFVQFSTDETMGAVTRDSNGHKEWATTLPSNPYSASKASQEALAIAWWRSFNVPIIITNTMNNFSPMQGATKYPAMIQSKLQKGEEIEIHAIKGEIGTRYYLHSRNAADAVLFILRKKLPYLHKAGKIDRPDRYNIVGDAQLDNLDLAKNIADLMGKELKYKIVDFHSQQPGHDLHYGLDGTKLKKLGWKPPMTFGESMEQTIKWQEEHPEWMK